MHRCGYCKRLAPQWSAAARSLKGLVHVAAVNCDEHAALCKKHGVAGYPHVAARLPGSPSLKEYSGEKTSAAISAWALGLLPSQVTALRTTAQLDALLARCGPNAAIKAADRAAWSACTILISGDKGPTPAALKALSLDLKGKVAVGEVQGAGPEGAKAAQALAARLLPEGEAVKLPVVVTVCYGDVGLREVYTGAVKAGPLAKHMAQFEGRKGCAGRLKLVGFDLGRFSTGQLQVLLKHRSLDCRGCAERGGFLQELQAYVAAGGL